MPLTLVTGPANAEKAGSSWTPTARRSTREPLLVVPTVADVERYRRELAAAGAVFGVAGRALRAGSSARSRGAAASRGRPLGRARARARRGGRGRARPRLDRLARSAAHARLPARVPRGSSTSSRSSGSRPARWYAALRAWAGRRRRRRRAYAEELGALYGAYRDGLERLGRRDARLHTRRGARRAAPRARALGRDAGLPLRLRRPHAAAARRRRDARGPLRRRGHACR